VKGDWYQEGRRRGHPRRSSGWRERWRRVVPLVEAHGAGVGGRVRVGGLGVGGVGVGERGARGGAVVIGCVGGEVVVLHC
jgi:hypothetical protein